MGRDPNSHHFHEFISTKERTSKYTGCPFLGDYQIGRDQAGVVLESSPGHSARQQSSLVLLLSRYTN